MSINHINTETIKTITKTYKVKYNTSFLDAQDILYNSNKDSLKYNFNFFPKVV